MTCTTSRVVIVAMTAAAGLLAVVACSGCVTETNPAAGKSGQRKVIVSNSVPPEFAGEPAGQPGDVRAGANAVPDGRAELDAITAADPCGNRMHALAGAMLLYYAVHRQLPPTLDALQPFADDTGEDLHFACPVSNADYVYDPAGLVSRGTEGRLVLYDAEPSHGGARWGVVAAPPRGTRPPTASAVRLTEQTFRRYLPAPPAAPQVP
jgi:hypothetical protein